MNGQRLNLGCGLMVSLVAIAGVAAEPPLKLDWGELKLRQEVSNESKIQPAEPPPPVPVAAPPIADKPSAASAMPHRVPIQHPPVSRRVATQPKMLNLEWSELYLQTEVQYEREGQQAGSPPSKVVREQTLVDPTAGVGMSGSVYHPNLMQFQLATELGLDWKDSQEDPGQATSNGRFLQRYHGTMDFLDQKPYAVSLFGDKDMTYREYDFFSRVRVDSEAAGGRAGYTAGPLPFMVSVQHYDEVQEDPIRPQNYTQDMLWGSVQHQRRRYDGRTRASYNLTQFSRRDDGFSHLQGVTQTLNLFDSENFGGMLDPRLTSLLNYNSVGQTAQPTDNLQIQENLHLQHTPKLESSYEYAFDHATSGASENRTQEGRANLNYQQTPHLTLGGDVHGNLTDSTSPGNSLETRSYGVGASAQYTRPLASWMTITCGDGGRWDREDRSASGTAQTVIGEQHTLSDGAVTLLNLPSANAASIKVYDATNSTHVYVANLDYRITPQGVLTQIERLTAGQIANGAQVAVDYSAALQDSASFDTLANDASFRVDLWRGLLGLYGHWASQVYSGGERLLLRRLDDKTVGLDAAWRWFRTGAEYEVVDSNLAPYTRRRLFQSAQFQPLGGTDLSLNTDENWTDFQDNNLHQTAYGFITRWQQRVSSHFSTTLEGGLRFERGQTFDRDYATCRAGVDWTAGKLTVKLSYEYNDESHLTDAQDRHYIFLRIRRDFR